VNIGQHHASIIAPLCSVDGEIDLFDVQAGGPSVIDVDGLGAHTHFWGTRMVEHKSSAATGLIDGRTVLLHAYGERVHRIDVTAEHVIESDSVVKRHRHPFWFTDVDLAFAAPVAIDEGVSLCDATIGGKSVKVLIETTRPSGLVRSWLGG
jgi:phage gp45-like